MRLNGNQVARSWTQFESQLPQGKIEPVVVEVEKNDTVIEGYPAFEKLVELSGIGMTPKEVLADLGIEKYTSEEGELKFYDRGSTEFLNEFGVCYKFLNRNYHRRWAFVKVGNREIYGLVQVANRKYKMPTSEGIIVMPSIYITNQTTGENEYVFFPISALLSEGEQALFELYRRNTVLDNDAVALEQEILNKLVKLSEMRKQVPNIVESNNQFAEIEEICRASGTIKKLSVSDGALVLEFDWRKVIDTDHSYEPMVLPPFKLVIDLRNYTVRGQGRYHPHVMNDNSLCMGGTLTDLVQKCITNRDLKTLVGGMIDFGNSWTSSDAMGCDRCPAGRIERYYDNEGIAWENIPVDLHDIEKTFDDCGYSTDSLGSTFNSLIEE